MQKVLDRLVQETKKSMKRSKRQRNLLIGSSDGENSAAFTLPLCPGNLYSSLPLSADHTITVPSPDPAAIDLLRGSQLACVKFMSSPVCAPSNVRMCRSVGANGRISHVRAVVSMESDSNDWLSGDTRRLVTVSRCPYRVYTTAFLRTSHTLILLSIPPVYSSCPASAMATAVMGKSV